MAARAEAAASVPLPITRPWIDSPYFETELERRAPHDEQRRRIATELNQKGFAVLRGFVDSGLIDRIVPEVATIYVTDPTAERDRRVQDVWSRGCDAVRELAVLPETLELLGFLYDRRPIPFQTLNFKWSTEQAAHADCLHFSCLPAGFMCGVWVALEDTDAGNGPLFYYPGSHRQPELTRYDSNQSVDSPPYELYERYQEALMRSLDIEPVEFHASKGDALIWTANIVHGGSPVREPGRTRWSQVTHYYFDDCVYYWPAASDFVTGELLLRDVVDVATGEHVPHRYNGRPVTLVPLGNGRSRISFDSTGTAPSNAVEVDELRARVARLEGEVRARDEELREVRSSESYRLGQMLVAPAARVRDFLRRR
jgi:hypothetical protein